MVQISFNSAPTLIEDMKHDMRTDERVLRWIAVKKKALRPLSDYKARDPRNLNLPRRRTNPPLPNPRRSRFRSTRSSPRRGRSAGTRDAKPRRGATEHQASIGATNEKQVSAPAPTISDRIRPFASVLSPPAPARRARGNAPFDAKDDQTF